MTKYCLTLIGPSLFLRTRSQGVDSKLQFFLMIHGVPRTYLGKVMKSRDIRKWLSGWIGLKKYVYRILYQMEQQKVILKTSKLFICIFSYKKTK